jgi:glycosyltransferase involved in cell wall biosynthesis
MPTYSLITAVLDGHHEHLPEAYESLRAQDLPEGWDWEWIVREDGATGRPLSVLPSDPRISSSTGARGRAATARTLALGRARGVVVRALDADDLLTDGALLRDLEALREHPEVGWCLSPTTDLLPDGTQRPGELVAGRGHVQPGYFLDARDRINLLSVAGSALCAYADLIRAVGGWPAVPANDDVALLLAVGEVSAGWMIDKPSLLYRRWQGNTTEALDQAAERAADDRRDAMLARATSLRGTGWRWKPRSAAG